MVLRTAPFRSTQAGVAQCAAGVSGTYAVVAWVIQDPGLQGGCASDNSMVEPGGNTVQGIAQLTCP
jgi:hypothetical protein